MYNEEDMALFLQALKFSSVKHAGQVRKGNDGTPYINHPVEVTTVLYNEAGVRDMVLLCAALLHDVIEDTGVTHEGLSVQFGKEIADIVEEVSDPKGLSQEEARARQIEIAPDMSYRAKLLRLADKACNVIDIAKSPPLWNTARRLEYLAWAKKVVDALGPVHPLLGAYFEKNFNAALNHISGKQS